MTRQTVIGHFSLLMAVHAPPHRHVHPWFGRGSFSFANVSMATRTLYFPQNHMTPVGKEDMVRLFVDTFPRDCLSSLLELSNFLFFRTFCYRLFMTFQAGGNGGNAGEGLVLIIRVAGNTLHPLFLMFFVAEGNRLFRLGPHA